MALIANMVGYNEADRHLDDVLAHLRTIADEIVFTDDGSDDNTLEIAAKYECHTYRSSEHLFEKHEGKLRQETWNNLENHAKPGDWILAIDCDEKLWATNPYLSLDNLMAQTEFDVLAIKFFHMWNETQFRVDKAWVPNLSTRMFRYFEGGKFAQRQLACGSEPSYVQELLRQGRFMKDTGLAMQHLGYVRDEDKLAKYVRYSTIDGGDFHAMAHINSIIDPNPTLVDWSA